MAVLAEQIESYVPKQNAEWFVPLVISIAETEQDKLVRARAARFIGAVATSNSAEIEPCTIEHPIGSLYDAIHRAAEGDQTARQLIETNARTDVIERTIKAGHITEVELVVDGSGSIQQHGQTIDSVQANSLRFASNITQMRERTEAETRNAFRIEQLYRQGVLNEYSFVILSRAADNMTHQQMSEVGFFTDTMSCAIQVTSTYNGGLKTETAFVAGVKNPEDDRHDAQTVVALAKNLGVDLSGKTAAEVLDSPILIHNSLLPGGVVDIVKLYDECAGGTFFGQAHLPEDYVNYRNKCAVRELSYKPKVDQIVNELISEAAGINSPLMATQRLHKISEKHMVEQALEDKTIDPRVFGQEASLHIELARWHLEMGNGQLARAEMGEAKSTARSSSCPTAGGEFGGDSAETKTKESDDGDCEFNSKMCPNCKAKNVKTKVSKNPRTGIKTITGKCGCSKIIK